MASSSNPSMPSGWIGCAGRAGNHSDLAIITHISLGIFRVKWEPDRTRGPWPVQMEQEALHEPRSSDVRRLTLFTARRLEPPQSLLRFTDHNRSKWNRGKGQAITIPDVRILGSTKLTSNTPWVDLSITSILTKAPSPPDPARRAGSARRSACRSPDNRRGEPFGRAAHHRWCRRGCLGRRRRDQSTIIGCGQCPDAHLLARSSTSGRRQRD